VPDHGGGGTEQETGVVDDVVGLAKAEEPEGDMEDRQALDDISNDRRLE
jgi:hypothetical protein